MLMLFPNVWYPMVHLHAKTLPFVCCGSFAWPQIMVEEQLRLASLREIDIWKIVVKCNNSLPISCTWKCQAGNMLSLASHQFSLLVKVGKLLRLKTIHLLFSCLRLTNVFQKTNHCQRCQIWHHTDDLYSRFVVCNKLICNRSKLTGGIKPYATLRDLQLIHALLMLVTMSRPGNLFIDTIINSCFSCYAAQHIYMYPYLLFAAIHHLNRPRLSLSDLVA